jgi:hypothetical protein
MNKEAYLRAYKEAGTLDSIKEHLSRHKKKYIDAGSTLAGALGGGYLGHKLTGGTGGAVTGGLAGGAGGLALSDYITSSGSRAAGEELEDLMEAERNVKDKLRPIADEWNTLWDQGMQTEDEGKIEEIKERLRRLYFFKYRPAWKRKWTSPTGRSYGDLLKAYDKDKSYFTTKDIGDLVREEMNRQRPRLKGSILAL